MDIIECKPECGEKAKRADQREHACHNVFKA